jgi:hypothetical protein
MLKYFNIVLYSKNSYIFAEEITIKKNKMKQLLKDFALSLLFMITLGTIYLTLTFYFL